MFHVEHRASEDAGRRAPGPAAWRADAARQRCAAGAGSIVAAPDGSGRGPGVAVGHGTGRRLAGVLFLAVLLLLPACAEIRSVRLYDPAASGLEPAGPDVYVDPAMTALQREAFAADLAAGRRRAAEFYGGLAAAPKVVACASMACYRRFGGIARKGVFRNGTILLSPEGLSPVAVAHEWSHAELAARVGWLRTWWRVPQWFDEGIAVVASRDPRYTEEAWRSATDNGAKAPALSSLESLRGWLRATGKDGETRQLSYGTARHEVARWYAAAGPAGLRELIANLKHGADFRESYDRVEREGAGRGRSTWNTVPGPGAPGPADEASRRGQGGR